MSYALTLAINISFILLTLLTITSSANGATTESEAQALFSSIGPERFRPANDIVSRRVVNIDPAAIRTAISEGRKLSINLPDTDATTLRQVESENRQFEGSELLRYVGKSDSSSASLAFTLVFGNDGAGLFGNLVTPAGSFTLETIDAKRGRYALVHYDFLGRADCPATPKNAGVPGSKAANKAPAIGGGSFGTVAGGEPIEIDAMVTYTPNAETTVGGPSAMLAKIGEAIAQANAAYVTNGLPLFMQLVKVHKLATNESGSYSIDLAKLSGQSDGIWDEIHLLRDQYAADLVHLIVSNSTVCGFGNLPLTNPPNSAAAFSMSHSNCTASNSVYTFVHETGHAFGNAHAQGDGVQGLYPYAYGYRTVVPGVSGKVGDVMAAKNSGDIRLNVFSDPNILVGPPGITPTIPLGIPEGQTNAANAALAVLVSAPYISAYRTALPGDLSHDLTVNGADLGLLLGSWGICDASPPCVGDITEDGEVNGADLGILLGGWTN